MNYHATAFEAMDSVRPCTPYEIWPVNFPGEENEEIRMWILEKYGRSYIYLCNLMQCTQPSG